MRDIAADDQRNQTGLNLFRGALLFHLLHSQRFIWGPYSRERFSYNFQQENIWNGAYAGFVPILHGVTQIQNIENVTHVEMCRKGVRARMRFDVNAHPAEISGLLNRFTAITGAAAWQKRETDFANQKHDNPLIDGYLDSHFPVEQAMIYVRRYRASTGGRIPEINTTSRVDLGTLYSFAALMARVFPKLPPHGQHVLRSRVIGALKDNVGLSPLAFEIRTVAHLMARGFDVEFHDLCGGRGCDFLVTNAEIQLEVECKSVSVDLGHR